MVLGKQDNFLVLMLVISLKGGDILAAIHACSQGCCL